MILGGNAAGVTPGRIGLFYARQVQALNRGDFAGYAATFTDDATFSIEGTAISLVGSSAITAHSRRLAAARAADGITQRHHVTMTELLARRAGIAATSTTLIVSTPLRGSGAIGAPSISAATQCIDEFIDDHGRLQIRSRLVLRLVTPDRHDTPVESILSRSTLRADLPVLERG